MVPGARPGNAAYEPGLAATLGITAVPGMTMLMSGIHPDRTPPGGVPGPLGVLLAVATHQRYDQRRDLIRTRFPAHHAEERLAGVIAGLRAIPDHRFGHTATIPAAAQATVDGRSPLLAFHLPP
jgi:hypothetical protein